MFGVNIEDGFVYLANGVVARPQHHTVLQKHSTSAQRATDVLRTIDSLPNCWNTCQCIGSSCCCTCHLFTALIGRRTLGRNSFLADQWMSCPSSTTAYRLISLLDAAVDAYGYGLSASAVEFQERGDIGQEWNAGDQTVQLP